MPVDKIKRAITWIRKSLEITEKTTQPGTVDGNIVPGIDVFGWDRYIDQTFFFISSSAGGSSVNTVAVPEDFCRFIPHASLDVTDDVQAFQTWWEIVEGSSRVAVSPIVDLAIGSAAVRSATIRPVLLTPGQVLSARVKPNVGAGLIINLRGLAVDLPIGEYIPGL